MVNNATGVVMEVDKFLRNKLPDQQITTQDKISQIKNLIARLKAVFPTVKDKDAIANRLSILNKSLMRLERAQTTKPQFSSLREKVLSNAKQWLTNYPEIPIPSEDAFAKTRKYLEQLKAVAIPPTNEEKIVINSLSQLLLRFKLKIKPTTYQVIHTPQVKGSPLPSVIKEAENFRKSMQKNYPSDVNGLRVAIYKGEMLIGKLRKQIAGYSYEEYNKWQPTFISEINAIRSLIEKWKAILESIHKREQEIRRYSWERERREYKRNNYLRAKQTAEIAGREKSVAQEVAGNIDNQLTRVCSSIDALMEKAERDKDPSILPIEETRRMEANAELLISGLKGKIDINMDRKLKNKLNLLKYKITQMNNLLKRLSSMAI